MLQRILDFFEKQTFGVCAWWGRVLGLRTQNIRLAFIYLSFITFGSVLFVYLIMAFILDNKEFFKFGRKRKSFWELD